MPYRITKESHPEVYEAMVKLQKEREANKPTWRDWLLIIVVGSAIFSAVVYSWIWVLGEWAKTQH